MQAFEPWLGFALFGTPWIVLGLGLTVVLKLMQRQRHLRACIPWLLGAITVTSVIYLAIAGGFPAIVYLALIVVLPSAILGLLLGLLTAIVVAIARRSFLVGIWIGLRMLTGSILAAINGFTIGCRVASPGIFAEMASPETAGDGILGITYVGLVLVLAVLPAIVMGAIVGSLLGYEQA